MKFRFLIIDGNTATVYGTNSQEEAIAQSKWHDFVVIDNDSGVWIRESLEKEIVQFDSSAELGWG